MIATEQIKIIFSHKLLILATLAIVAFGLILRQANILFSRSYEKGINEVTRQVQIEAQTTGKDPCELLKGLRVSAKKAKDTSRLMKIQQAEKFFGCRNQQKRGSP